LLAVHTLGLHLHVNATVTALRHQFQAVDLARRHGEVKKCAQAQGTEIVEPTLQGKAISLLDSDDALSQNPHSSP
jgi:hypothetical protein